MAALPSLPKIGTFAAMLRLPLLVHISFATLPCSPTAQPFYHTAVISGCTVLLPHCRHLQLHTCRLLHCHNSYCI